MNDIVTSLHGREIGLDAQGRLVVRNGYADSPEVNVVSDHGADPTGVRSSSAAMSAAWAAVKALRNSTYEFAPITLVIPPGVYLIDTSINWTGDNTTYLGWNTHIKADGAVFVGSCTGKPIVDMVGVRGVHLSGLAFYGSTTSIPSCAIFIGPRLSGTCGNNKFEHIKTKGYFSLAPYWSIGSETTQHEFCYYMNNNPSASAYAAAFDGMNRLGATSDYASIRAANVNLSYTNNRFVGCRFQKDTDGYAVYMEASTGWTFDRDCYFLAFDKAGFYIRTDSTNRVTNLKVEGLFETTQGSGLKYCFVWAIPEENVATVGFYADVGSPHAATATIRVQNVANGNDLTSGFLRFDNAYIKQTGNVFSASTPMFSGAFIYWEGEIWCDTSAILNLATLTRFHGIVHTSDLSGGTLPGGNSTGILFERNTRNIRLFGLQNFASDAAAASGSIAVGGLYRNGSAVQIRVT